MSHVPASSLISGHQVRNGQVLHVSEMEEGGEKGEEENMKRLKENEKQTETEVETDTYLLGPI